ncbi:MAG: Tim44 domain-containing protein [Polyangiaceae bacterium]|nr:Tim44 domain-containing protein [Polyangiaceae bacterium]
MGSVRHILVATLAALVLVAAPVGFQGPRLTEVTCGQNWAAARPGGGHAFRGSSSRSSFGSGSFRLGSGSTSRRSSANRVAGASGTISTHPVPPWGLVAWLFSSGFGTFGVLAIGALIVLVRIVSAAQNAKLDWQAGVAEKARQLGRVRSDLEQLRQVDSNFSLVLLDDFLYALYAQAQTLRGGGQLGRLAAYLKPEARQALEALGPVRNVDAIVVGAMRFLWVNGLTPASTTVRLEVEFESNYTEHYPDGTCRSCYASESWVLARGKAVASRTPDRVRVFTCPHCGGPLDGMDGSTCRYCRATVDTGQFDWIVEGITVTSHETRGPMLTGDTKEAGTRLDTLVDEDVSVRFTELTARDPQFRWPAFQARVGLIFQRMQVAWSNRDWTAVRPFVSDNLFQMLGYWIEAYRRAGLRNITEDARIESMDLARITADRFYDAITVRVFASSKDFTVRDVDGAVVGGSRSRTRAYTEYWTLIRGSGRQGSARTDANCPACGAPLAVEMAGACRYCQAKVTSGQFDWVLSRIEQDEVYQG